MTPLEMIGDKKDERQLKKLKLQDEYIVSKENISFNGFLKNYIEVADDGVISFISGENKTNDICFTVNLKKKKGWRCLYCKNYSSNFNKRSYFGCQRTA